MGQMKHFRRSAGFKRAVSKMNFANWIKEAYGIWPIELKSLMGTKIERWDEVN